MPVPYEATGRRDQKARTREALVAATRRLLADGVNPTVEQAAAEARISRTTAYRYFPSQRSLLLAAHPEISQRSLLPADAPADDVPARLDQVLRAFARVNLDWEPQLRTSLRLSLEPGAGEPGAEQPVLRQGRAIDWIEDALDPLRESHPEVDVRRLAIAIRATTGIESLIWLTDIAGLSRADAVELMRKSGQALLAAYTGQERTGK
ncbi:TetR/AcrR family transcriptional regulator [Actinoplanes sp. KI2]|uniref:TetR/AcrR family transcriptional regulator n=1 Tax=Actinoplanes sp. KI2 TaxID=2983315 RepID=UPI0021D5B4BE|nr:TetR/AcrR family transcriptional regulator [Actinoplanes sp. KI2]MCU7724210.1 TetR/AcrR family transcriptional regulator [Actinoplanes sp. KI2]